MGMCKTKNTIPVEANDPGIGKEGIPDLYVRRCEALQVKMCEAVSDCITWCAAPTEMYITL